MNMVKSIRDTLFDVAARLGKRLGVSQVQLYRRTVKESFQDHRRARVSLALDSIYGDDSKLDRLDARLEWLQNSSIIGNE